MALIVTVDVFSGRPNPVLVLEGRDEQEALARLRPGKRQAQVQAPPRSFLGYRGLQFELTNARRRTLPSAFRLWRGVLFGDGLAAPASDPGFEAWFTSAAGPLGRLGLGAAFHKRLEAERHREDPKGGDGDKDDRREREEGHGKRGRCECAPLYEPAWWNDGGQRQWNNNCYNYSTNYRSDTFAQPGLAAGAMYATLSCGDVRAGAIADDLIDDPKANNRCPKEGHLVALVVAPGWDFHWYRKGRTGYWSHKPGGTQATNRDNSAHLIPDPRTADRGPYTDFCTFMIVMHGHIKIL
jgi:hypothetical protein